MNQDLQRQGNDENGKGLSVSRINKDKRIGKYISSVVYLKKHRYLLNFIRLTHSKIISYFLIFLKQYIVINYISIYFDISFYFYSATCLLTTLGFGFLISNGI